MRVHRVIVFVLVSLAAQNSHAQMVQVVRTHPNGGEASVSRDAEAPKNAPMSAQPIDALTQLAIQSSGDGATARVQALTFYLLPKSDRFRFYVNSQLPVHDSSQNTSATGSSSSGSSGAASQSSTKTSPSDYLKSQLLDEYGGLLNLSVGHYGKLNAGALKKLYAGDSNHGLLLDVRSGVKLMELPGQPDQSSGFLKQVSPFFANVAMVSFSAPLYDQTVQGDSRKAAGGLVLGLSLANNYAADASYASDFSTQLHRSLSLVNIHAAVSILTIGDIEISGTVYSNDGNINRKLLLSFNARR